MISKFKKTSRKPAKTAFLATLVCLSSSIFAITAATIMASAASAQSADSVHIGDRTLLADPLGVRDTIFATVSRLGDQEWTVNIGYFSDVELFGLSIPLRFTAGLNRVLIDSTIFIGGKVEHFEVKIKRADTAIQTLTIGLIAGLHPKAKTLEAGTGRLATVFLHADMEGRAPALKVDTTTTYPENSLMLVQNAKPPENKQTKIYPVFVFKSDEKPGKKK